ncbi:MAG: ATP-binding protein [Chloroflexi bacterium]|nr:ATP-binding protein [Chloroflexota bacterium]
MNYEIAAPNPSSLIESLRSVGYSLSTAVADIIDNSIAAEAGNVWVHFHWAGAESHVSITDDGHGMSEEELHEAMRPGSRSPIENRDPSDLGRFGLGLKTASFSQCRRLAVVSRRKGHPFVARTWDLDYVVHHNEWRLLKTADPVVKYAEKLDKKDSGTVVFWGHMDRLTEGENTGDAAAHNRFNDSIDSVGRHVALTFHRFIEDGSVKIHLNGCPVVAWNPFLEGHTATYRTPEEVIPFGESEVGFRGYVLPHKDMLTDEECMAAAGPAGWTAHQGFYVYRSRRLLVPGDWLRLGRPNPWTKAEHYNLARIRLDLPNDTDGQWHLDVKKSTARPPALIRDRLTELADNIRTRARSVFVHRGRYGTRMPPVNEFERPWEATTRNGQRVYRINRSHPAIKAVLQAAGKTAPEIESLLRVLEETVPVQQIWLDVAEQTKACGQPYAGVDFSLIRSDIRRVYEFFVKSGINKATALARLRTIEPYNRYPQLIGEL